MIQPRKIHVSEVCRSTGMDKHLAYIEVDSYLEIKKIFVFQMRCKDNITAELMTVQHFVSYLSCGQDNGDCSPFNLSVISSQSNEI